MFELVGNRRRGIYEFGESDASLLVDSVFNGSEALFHEFLDLAGQNGVRDQPSRD